jgi:hypothetical protein
MPIRNRALSFICASVILLSLAASVYGEVHRCDYIPVCVCSTESGGAAGGNHHDHHNHRTGEDADDLLLRHTKDTFNPERYQPTDEHECDFCFQYRTVRRDRDRQIESPKRLIITLLTAASLPGPEVKAGLKTYSVQSLERNPLFEPKTAPLLC